jgi:hypothetical protein
MSTVLSPSTNDYRTFDGSGNNIRHPAWGSAGQNLLRISAPVYGDGISSLASRSANPRTVSNNLCKYPPTIVDIPEPHRVSNMCWAWEQFLDHELDLTPHGSTEPANIVAPPDDPNLPGGTIPFLRSIYDPSTGTSTSNPRQQPNLISSYIDASNVYGSDVNRAGKLRANDGTGKLATSLSNGGEILPPLNTMGLPNDILPDTDPNTYYVAGDVRANENVILLGMHTLFLREHNRLCSVLVAEHPSWRGNDELLYQEARKRVVAEMQVITYHEFLPLILGRQYAPWAATYPGYDSTVDAGITTEFATVGYRLGHSMVSGTLKSGPYNILPLRDAFFRPSYVRMNSVDNLLLGVAQTVMQKLDRRIVEDIRSFLFGAPNAQTNTLRDLAALNMQRAKDHGIADYNSLRKAYGLGEVTDFSQISSNHSTVATLKRTYDDDLLSIDPWIGALCEDPTSDSAMTGPLISAILVEQFERTRSGDRYWYENDPTLTDEEKCRLSRIRLSDILRKNTAYKDHYRDDVFRVSESRCCGRCCRRCCQTSITVVKL